MSRISLPDVSTLSDQQRQQYERFPSNLTRALLRTTGSTDPYISLGRSFSVGAIDNKDREMVILRVGALSHSAYERMEHYQLAMKAGWSSEEIQAIEVGRGGDERSQAILQFVEECVHNVKVSAQSFAAVRAFYNETQVAELSLLVGHYMMTARFLETLEVPLDAEPTPWR